MKFRTALKGAAAPIALSVALAANPAFAQANEAPENEEVVVGDDCPDVDNDGVCDTEVSELGQQDMIIVSGTRIRTTQYDFANPVVAIGEDAIENSGVTNLTSFLTEAPALTGSFDSNDGSGANAGIGGVGLNLLDLRNLGTQRTLLLIDGRRHVAAVPGSSSVDVNTIPIDLIERVDIVTGGASAIYGADAVTGVVNFVTKRDFEGLSLRAQTGISEELDNESQFFALTAGKNFNDGRGNIAASFEYGHDDRFILTQRDEFRSENFFGFRPNPDERLGDDDPNVPDRMLFNDLRYADSNPLSAIDLDGDQWPDVIGDGSAFIPGIYTGSYIDAGGSGTPVSTYSGEILPQIDRYIGNVLASYEIFDDVTLFAEGKYARVESASVGQPTFDFFIAVPNDNPYIPASIASAPNAWGDAYGVTLITGRDNLDLGRRGEDNTRETYRGVLGIEAILADNLSFEASYVYGQSDVEVRQTATRFNDRFFAALDAVDEGEFLTGTPNGNIVCRSDLTGDASVSNQLFGIFVFDDFEELSFTPGANSGCVPINLFQGRQSQAALDWILTEAVDRSTVKQHVASASLSGDFGESVRLWGDEIGFAVGAEYRKEKSASFPDPVNTTGLTFGNALFPEVGSFDVYEGFAELRVPIVQDQPFFYDLTANGAVRVSDYSTVGTTWTYQGGLVWSPIEDIRFRGTYAQAVRAPNIGELFAPANQTFAFIDDPCVLNSIDDGSEFRRANCEAILANLGLTPDQIENFNAEAGTNLPGLIRGNEDLMEETAKTITAGVILRPRFIPGLILSADYYDVTIEDAVSTPGATDVAELCVDAPTIDNQFCDLIERNPADPVSDPDDTVPDGLISGFTLFPANVAEFQTRGVDFSARYTTGVGNLGNLSLSVVGNWLDTLKTQATPGSDFIESAGVTGAPEWQVNFDLNWSIDNFNLNYGINYFDETLRYSRQTVEDDPDIVAPEYLYIDAKFTHDVQVAYTFEDTMTAYVGVNNLFDQNPDVGLTYYPVPAIGRFFYIGVRTSLDDLGF